MYQYYKQRKFDGQYCEQRIFDGQYCKQRKCDCQYCKQRWFDRYLAWTTYVWCVNTINNVSLMVNAVTNVSLMSNTGNNVNLMVNTVSNEILMVNTVNNETLMVNTVHNVSLMVKTIKREVWQPYVDICPNCRKDTTIVNFTSLPEAVSIIKCIWCSLRNYEKKAKTIQPISIQLQSFEKYRCWDSRSWLGTNTQCDWVKPVNGISTTTFW